MQDTCLVRPERGSSRKHTSESQHPEGNSWLFLPSAYSRDPGSLVPLSEQMKHVGLVFELQGQSKEPQAQVALLRGSLAPTQCWVPQFLRSRLGLPSMQLNINLCVSVEHRGRGGLQVTMIAPPAPGSGHAGDPNLRTGTQTKRGQGSGSPFLPLPVCPPSLGIRRFCDESHGSHLLHIPFWIPTSS